MKTALKIFFAALLACSNPLMAADKIAIAAAADLKFAMQEIVALFAQSHPGKTVETIYGSSGKFYAQIRQGAPFDLYFSADIAYPQLLERDGFAATPTRRYAIGRLVLWSPTRDASKMSLTDLADPSIRKIAIANPKHAPYGKRAEEALRAAGVWNAVANKLVMGENIAQTAQFVHTGNADVGIIALSLALNKALAAQGRYALIDDRLHEPLDQGFIITRRAAGNALARQFADFMAAPEARRIMIRHGFALPGEQ